MNGCGSHEHTGHDAEHAERSRPARRWGPLTTTTVVLIGFLGVAGAFLFEEHRGHALGAFPYLLLVAAMFFCMFGHGGHRDDDSHRTGGPST
ncbi:MAG TPA: DUF2933 domain-containing protein [Kofleriaceae bacterium]|nr:DUF2933 domain-containing protein [Kofleriaceae bacterium]